ncbi:ComGF family competence protein [Enterococcus gallinarum]|nr:ComGF family competence protein [Enterococcus gallinarum]
MADIFDSVRKGASNVYVCFSESVYTFLKSSKENVVTIDRINGKVRKRDNNGYHPLLTEVSLIYFEKRHPRSSLQ